MVKVSFLSTVSILSGNPGVLYSVPVAEHE